MNETCTSGAGTLLLEFGLLSRLLDDPVYEGYARRTVDQLWSHRSNVTGLFGKSAKITEFIWSRKVGGILSMVRETNVHCPSCMTVVLQ